MNKAMIRYILGYVLSILALLLLLPCLVALIYQEMEGFHYLAVAAFGALLGYLMIRKKPEDTVFHLKEGCIATALSWIVMSLYGCLPFWISGEIPSFTDALFETISGFTTTGSSILSDVEALSHCALFWRSFTHWIGGMGVLVFLLAVIPLSGGSNMNLMRAESPGPSVGKLVPKVKHTARILYLIYLGMTILQVLFLLAGKLPLFDALTTTFGTAGTGGFAIKNDSMMSYTAYQQWVYTIFMALFGVNFNAYYLILFGKFKKAFAMEEVRWYFIIIFCSTAFIFFQIMGNYSTAFEALAHAAFQVSTIITTTGFATTDFNLWPAASRTVLVLLMFIGACAGSTGGAIKCSRVLLRWRHQGIALCRHGQDRCQGDGVLPSSEQREKNQAGRQTSRPRGAALHQRLFYHLHDHLRRLGLSGLAGRARHGDQLHRRCRHLQQHRSRPGRGRPNTEFRCAFHSLQIHPDV